MTNSAEPYTFKPPANWTVLGYDQGGANEAKEKEMEPKHPFPWASLPSQISLLILGLCQGDAVTQVLFICSALATAECYERAGEGQLFPVSSGIIWCSLWCLMWSCHWLKLSIPLDHWQPGTFVSHNHCMSVLPCVTAKGFGMSGTIWAFYVSLTHLNPFFD